jgi:DNA (cytosine-5)-methyltransferase 1
MIDVFAGAGGLSLGFKWAGWRTLAATDLDARAIDAFNQNVDPLAFVADMEEDSTLVRLNAATRERRAGKPLAIVGGPPCQGFSTGGKRRSETDERNLLHHRYAELLQLVRPDIFVFENVLGLLSLTKGAFLQQIIAGMRAVGYEVDVWRLNAASFGVPQRRQRVVIVGVKSGQPLPRQPQPWCDADARNDLVRLSKPITVGDAIGDLPALEAGEDGSKLDYRVPPQCSYQSLMRGHIDAIGYLGSNGLDISRLAA